MTHWLSFRTTQAAGAAAFFPLLGKCVQSATEAQITIPISAPFTVSQWIITLDTAPGGVTAYTYTVKKNGSAAALTITITGAATTGSDLVNSVTFAAGDTCVITRTRTGTPANGEIFYTLQVDTTTTTSNVYGSSCTTSLSTSVARYNGVFYGGPANTSTLGFGAPATLVPITGTLTRYDVKLSAAPGILGSGKSYTFVIYKALAATPTTFVKQDGSGGTVNTTITISETATTGTASFSLTFAPGDVCLLEDTPANTPTAGIVNTCGYAFTAAIPGESMICGNTQGAGGLASFSATVDNYIRPTGNTPTATETAETVNGLAHFTLGKLHVQLNASQGAGKAVNIGIRRDVGSPTHTPNVTISGATDTTGHDTVNRVTITSANTWDIRTSPVAGSGTARQAIWGMAQNGVVRPTARPFIGPQPAHVWVGPPC